MKILKDVTNSINGIRQHVNDLDTTLSSLIDSLEEFIKFQEREPIKIDNFVGLTNEEREQIIGYTKDPVIITIITEQFLIRKNTNSNNDD